MQERASRVSCLVTSFVRVATSASQRWRAACDGPSTSQRNFGWRLRAGATLDSLRVLSQPLSVDSRRRRSPMTTPTIEPRMELEQNLHMYRQMAKIRAFEEQVHELYKSAKMPGLAHLYVGEEAVAVGVCEALRKDDLITSTHRGHGHCLAKGA